MSNFTIAYDDLIPEAQADYDQFIRDCGGNCIHINQARESKKLAIVFPPVLEELITYKSKDAWDEYHNNMTDEMNEYLLKDALITLEYACGTYLSGRPSEGHMGIRFPGATRGGIVFDEKNIITKISMYHDEAGERVQCYRPEVDDILQKYVGAKLIFSTKKV